LAQIGRLGDTAEMICISCEPVFEERFAAIVGHDSVGRINPRRTETLLRILAGSKEFVKPQGIENIDAKIRILSEEQMIYQIR